jgi:hypothetical protein
MLRSTRLDVTILTPEGVGPAGTTVEEDLTAVAPTAVAAAEIFEIQVNATITGA